MSGFSLTVIPNNDDNFCYYLFAPGQESSGVLVDVGEATPVLAFCEARGISPSAILSTHKHWDHTGGNSELAQRFEGLQIVGGENDEVTGCTTPVSNDHTLEIAGLKVKCHHTPCHTTGHILYFVTGGDLDESQTHEKAILEGFVNVSHINAGVFTGDTLFIGGCGRFFEGTPPQMLHAMDVLSKMPDYTKVFCGHEYTLQNYEFAVTVEMSSEALADQVKEAKSQLEQGLHTIPSTIEIEKATNVFMRCRAEAIHSRLGTTDPEECMNILRSSKDGGKVPPKL